MPIARALIVAALAAGTPAAQPVPEAAGRPKLDFAAHVAGLKPRLPRGFHVVVQPPFVVVGDGSARLVEAWATGTVKWAVGHLKKSYFDEDPSHIIDIWLFKDGKSYRKHARELFGDRPATPFGYYSPKHRALIMNIATGGGTLVHEIVHPFIHANFPDCPAWFNEGLASLYEQCREKDGKIVGLTNWRLEGLRRAIRKKRLPAFASLLATTERQFYGDDRGTNYAQARYLCYYLQERGVLRTFYHEFRRNREADPTGYGTLRKVLGGGDMDGFQKEWEAWVLALRFR